jgi:hypothetical protein
MAVASNNRLSPGVTLATMLAGALTPQRQCDQLFLGPRHRR